MKKSTRNILVVGSISLAAGLLICMIASVFGAGKVFANIVETGDIAGFHVPFVWFNDTDITWSGWDDLDGTVISSSQKGEDIVLADKADVCNLEIECGAAKIMLLESGDNDIHLINNSNTKIKYKRTNDNLIIRCKGRTNNTGTVELYLPKDMAFDDIEIELGAGVLENDICIKADNLDVEVGAGQVRFQEVSAATAELSVGAGQLVMEDNCGIGELEAEVAMGELVYEGSIYSMASVSVAMGDARISLDDEEKHYSFDVSGGMGNISVGGRTISAGAYDADFGEGDKELSLECAMGNITVNFGHHEERKSEEHE